MQGRRALGVDSVRDGPPPRSRKAANRRRGSEGYAYVISKRATGLDSMVRAGGRCCNMGCMRKGPYPLIARNRFWNWGYLTDIWSDGYLARRSRASAGGGVGRGRCHR